MEFKHLKRYERPECYAGRTYYDYFPFLTQHRDSDVITRSNFRVGLERLGGESETVLVVRDHHWAVGWIEFIYIHESDTAALQKADEMLEDIESYPALSDDDWTELEYTEGFDYLLEEFGETGDDDPQTWTERYMQESGVSEGRRGIDEIDWELIERLKAERDGHDN